ncbi:MAG: hypothetical protein KTR30_28630 [Saprospiraceae bacterium]|nr:hypothetical protein [Saprospiraceae bacterium]
MKRLIKGVFGSFLLISLACNTQEKEAFAQDAQTVLERCFQFHDPDEEWASWAGTYVSVEPRLQVPGRKTKVQLQADGSFFDMERAYGKDTLHWTIKERQYSTFVNGELVQDTATMQAYRLSQERADGYHNYYRTKLGLPMSLKGRYQLKQEAVEPMEWQGKTAFRLELEIADGPFSTAWELFVDSKNYQLLGYGFFPTEAEGEYLVVDQLMEMGQMKWPRMRHWYSRGEDEYLGSDIILKASPMHD